MTDTEKITFKSLLKRWALDQITQRITNSRLAIDQARESANSEEKSSAGDKYETGRAMGHLQQEMHSRQLAEYLKELAILHAVNIDQLCPEGRVGAFLQSEDFAFFIAAGLGRHVVEGQTILFLSPQAPLAKFLQNKKAGDNITFNNINTTIQMVF